MNGMFQRLKSLHGVSCTMGAVLITEHAPA
jgi:hypothetical protein